MICSDTYREANTGNRFIWGCMTKKKSVLHDSRNPYWSLLCCQPEQSNKRCNLKWQVVIHAKNILQKVKHNLCMRPFTAGVKMHPAWSDHKALKPKLNSTPWSYHLSLPLYLAGVECPLSPVDQCPVDIKPFSSLGWLDHRYSRILSLRTKNRVKEGLGSRLKSVI